VIRFTNHVGLTDDQIDEAIRLAGVKTALTATVRAIPFVAYLQSHDPHRRSLRPHTLTTPDHYYLLYGKVVLCVELLMSQHIF